MNAEIIAVGTEIMLGDIQNAHASYISRALAELGINVCFHTAVGDNALRLKKTFAASLMRSDLVILTGGLGPTEDDLTKEVICETVQVPLVENEKILADIEAFFERNGRSMPDCNKKQAMIPRGAYILKNNCGTAPGIILESEKREKIIIMLPGPPRELHPMFKEQVVPYLQQMTDSAIVSKNLRVIGLGESRVQEMTKDLLEGENPTAALYAGTGQVRIRLTAKAKTEYRAKEMLMPLEAEFKRRLGDTIYSTDESELSEAVVRLLQDRGLTVTTAESCTGGLLAEKITAVPGASEIFEYGVSSYANRAKEKFLHVHPKTLYLYSEVSAHTAIEMARGAQKNSGADIAVSVTGYAGPGGGNEHNPVGTVFIALAYQDRVWVERITAGHGHSNERETIREIAALQALDMIRHAVLNTPRAALCLLPVEDAFAACNDPIIKATAYTPKGLRILKTILPWKGDSIPELMRKVVLLFAIVVFAISAVLLGQYVTEKIVSDTVVAQTQDLYHNEPTPQQLSTLPYGYLEKFAALYSENHDITGWITVPDSKIDFPVMQGIDNDHYLSHDFYDNYNENGVPYVDYRNSISTGSNMDDNTLLYAHNIRGGRFFSEICNFKDLEFYKARPVLTFDTVYEEIRWKIVACFITNADGAQNDGEVFDYNNYLHFETEADFDWYMEEINRRNLIDTGVDVQYGDKLLTLSTCTYEFDNARFVLVARRVRIGEDPTVDTSLAAYKPNPLYPQAWYDKHGGEKPLLPNNPEPLSKEEAIAEILNDPTVSAVPFYELLSSYDESKADTASYKKPYVNTKSQTSSSFTDRFYYEASSKKTGSKKTSSKKTSSKKKAKDTSSKKATSKASASTNSENTSTADTDSTVTEE